MNIELKAKHFTLDWDNISIEEAYRRCQYILDNYANVRELLLSLSPTKGFHVRVHLYGASYVARMRNEMKDDGNRLIHDILNRPDNIHDVLWSRKTIQGIPWEERHLKLYRRNENDNRCSNLY